MLKSQLPHMALVVFFLLVSCKDNVVREKYVIDGRFQDWQKIKPTLIDQQDAPNSYVDFDSLWIANDSENFYLSFDVSKSVNLSLLDGTISFLLDMDGDNTTGGNYGNFSGVDLIIDFSPPRFFGENTAYLGAAARLVVKDSESRNLETSINLYETGFVHAPTFASSKYEMSIKQNIVLKNGVKISTGESVRGRLVYINKNGIEQDETDIFSYKITAGLLSASRQSSDPLERPEISDFRVVSWNVADQVILSNPTEFRKVLSALNPDIIMLDEVSGIVIEKDISAILPKLPKVDDVWKIVMGKSGGYQHGVIASHLPMELVQKFEFLEFPENLVKKHVAKIKSSKRLSSEKYHLSHGVSTVAAEINIQNKRILFVTVDLQSRGRFDSPEEAKRQLEAQTIREAAIQVYQQKNMNAVIIAGDFNLVGSKKPLDDMRAWHSVFGKPLELCLPLQLDGRSNFTWFNSNDIFPPGELDFMLYNKSGVSLTSTFIFNSYKLENKWLEKYRIERDVSGRTSDHLPIVSDFLLTKGNE